MKLFFISIACCLVGISGFCQDTIGTADPLPIKVPDFADPQVKAFYQSYAEHLIKCVKAIRLKDEAKVTALFKNPGEQLVAREQVLSKEVVKNPKEKEKYLRFAAMVYPYLKEVQHSPYYKKLYGLH